MEGCRLADGSGVNHSLFVVQTNSEMAANHYSFVVQTNSGTGAYHYSFVVQTYSGSRVDLYRSLLPPHGGGGGASDGGGRLALRSHLRLYQPFLSVDMQGVCSVLYWRSLKPSISNTAEETM